MGRPFSADWALTPVRAEGPCFLPSSNLEGSCFRDWTTTRLQPAAWQAREAQENVSSPHPPCWRSLLAVSFVGYIENPKESYLEPVAVNILASLKAKWTYCEPASCNSLQVRSCSHFGCPEHLESIRARQTYTVRCCRLIIQWIASAEPNSSSVYCLSEGSTTGSSSVKFQGQEPHPVRNASRIIKAVLVSAASLPFLRHSCIPKWERWRGKRGSDFQVWNKSVTRT